MSTERRVTPRRAAALAVLLAAALGTAGFTAAPPGSPGHAKGSPSVTAQPSTNLSDGQYLTVTFSGYSPGEPFDFRECIAAPTSVDLDCTALLQINRTPVTAILDSKGQGSTYIPVYSGTDPLLENQGASGPLTCDITHSCVVAVMPNPTDLTTAALIPVSFGASPDLCPNASGIVGSGSAAAYRAMYQWSAAVCQPPSSLPVTYTLKNSPDGVLNFLSGLTQFGVTGPWSPSYVPTATSTPAQTWDYAPLTMSGVVLAYRMYDLRGPQITTLTLTPDQIARIFTGSLNDLAADSGVTALNPGITFPSLLNVFVRAEHSADSWVFSSWLARNDPATWKYGGEEIFPAPFGVIAATGSAAVGFDVLSNPNQTFAGQGTIGFMDSTTAAYYGLPTVRIANADGTVTAATPATIAKAVSEATLNSDGTVTAGPADDAAWPMLMPTDMMVPTNNVTATVGGQIAALLRYAVQAGQANLPTGDVPLTPAMAAAALTAAAAIPITAAPPPPVLKVPAPPSASVPYVPSSGLGVVPQAAVTHTPSAAATKTTPKRSVINAAPVSAPLLLAPEAAPMLLPSALALGAGGLLAGALLEVLGRRRRSTTSGSEEVD